MEHNLLDVPSEPKITIKEFQEVLAKFVQASNSLGQSHLQNVSKLQQVSHLYKTVWKTNTEQKSAKVNIPPSPSPQGVPAVPQPSAITFVYQYPSIQLIDQQYEQYLKAANEVNEKLTKELFSAYFKFVVADKNLKQTVDLFLKQNEDLDLLFDAFRLILVTIYAPSVPIFKNPSLQLQEISNRIGQIILDDKYSSKSDYIVEKIITCMIQYHSTHFNCSLFRPSILQVITLHLLSFILSEQHLHQYNSTDDVISLLKCIPVHQLLESHISASDAREFFVEPIRHALQHEKTDLKLMVQFLKMIASVAEQYKQDLFLDCLLTLTRGKYPSKTVSHLVVHEFPFSSCDFIDILNAVFQEMFHLKHAYDKFSHAEKQHHNNAFINQFLLPSAQITQQVYSMDEALKQSNQNLAFPILLTLKQIALQAVALEENNCQLASHIIQVLVHWAFKIGTTNASDLTKLMQLRTECLSTVFSCAQNSQINSYFLQELYSLIAFLAHTQIKSVDAICNALSSQYRCTSQLSQRDLDLLTSMIQGNVPQIDVTNGNMMNIRSAATQFGTTLFVKCIDWKQQPEAICIRALESIVFQMELAAIPWSDLLDNLSTSSLESLVKRYQQNQSKEWNQFVYLNLLFHFCKLNKDRLQNEEWELLECKNGILALQQSIKYYSLVLDQYMDMLIQMGLHENQSILVSHVSWIPLHNHLLSQLPNMIIKHSQWLHLLFSALVTSSSVNNDSIAQLLNQLIFQSKDQSLMEVIAKEYTFSSNQVLQYVHCKCYFLAQLLCSCMKHQLPPFEEVVDDDTMSLYQQQQSSNLFYFDTSAMPKKKQLNTKVEAALWLTCDIGYKLLIQQPKEILPALLFWDRFFDLYFQVDESYFPQYMRERYSKGLSNAATSNDKQLNDLLMNLSTFDRDKIEVDFMKRGSVYWNMLVQYHLPLANQSNVNNQLLNSSLVRSQVPLTSSQVLGQQNMMQQPLATSQRLPMQQPNPLQSSQMASMYSSQFSAQPNTNSFQQVRMPPQHMLNQSQTFQSSQQMQMNASQMIAQRPIVPLNASQQLPPPPMMNSMIATRPPVMANQPLMHSQQSSYQAGAQSMHPTIQHSGLLMRPQQQPYHMASSQTLQSSQQLNSSTMMKSSHQPVLQSPVDEIRSTTPISINNSSIPSTPNQLFEFIDLSCISMERLPTDYGNSSYTTASLMDHMKQYLNGLKHLNGLNQQFQAMTRSIYQNTNNPNTIVPVPFQNTTIQASVTTNQVVANFEAALLNRKQYMEFIQHHLAPLIIELGNEYLFWDQQVKHLADEELVKEYFFSLYHVDWMDSIWKQSLHEIWDYFVNHLQAISKLFNTNQQVQFQMIQILQSYQASGDQVQDHLIPFIQCIDPNACQTLQDVLQLLSQAIPLYSKLSSNEMRELCNQFDLSTWFIQWMEMVPLGQRFTEREEVKSLLLILRMCLSNNINPMGEQLLKLACDIAYPNETSKFLQFMLALTSKVHVPFKWHQIVFANFNQDIDSQFYFVWLQCIFKNRDFISNENINAILAIGKWILLDKGELLYLQRIPIQGEQMNYIVDFFGSCAFQDITPNNFSSTLHLLSDFTNRNPFFIDRVWQLYVQHLLPTVLPIHHDVNYRLALSQFMSNSIAKHWVNATFHEKDTYQVLAQSLEHMVHDPASICAMFQRVNWNNIYTENNSNTLVLFVKLYMDIQILINVKDPNLQIAIQPVSLQSYLDCNNIDNTTIWDRVSPEAFVNAFAHDDTMLLRLIKANVLHSDPSEKLVNYALWLDTVAKRMQNQVACEVAAKQVRSVMFFYIKSVVPQKPVQYWFLPWKHHTKLLTHSLLPMMKRYPSNIMMQLLFSCLRDCEKGALCYELKQPIAFGNSQSCPFDLQAPQSQAMKEERAKLREIVKGLIVQFTSNCNDFMAASIISTVPSFIGELEMSTICDIMEDTCVNFLKQSPSYNCRDEMSKLLFVPQTCTLYSNNLTQLLEKCIERKCAVFMGTLIYRLVEYHIKADHSFTEDSICNAYAYFMSFVCRFVPHPNREYCIIYLFLIAMELTCDARFWKFKGSSASDKVNAITVKWLKQMNELGNKFSFSLSKVLFQDSTKASSIDQVTITPATCLACKACEVYARRLMLSNKVSQGIYVDSASENELIQKEFNQLMKMRTQQSFKGDYEIFFSNCYVILSNNIDLFSFRDLIQKLYPLVPFIARV